MPRIKKLSYDMRRRMQRERMAQKRKIRKQQQEATYEQPESEHQAASLPTCQFANSDGNETKGNDEDSPAVQKKKKVKLDKMKRKSMKVRQQSIRASSRLAKQESKTSKVITRVFERNLKEAMVLNKLQFKQEKQQGQEEVTETLENAMYLRENNSFIHSNSLSQSSQELTSDFISTKNEYSTGLQYRDDPLQQEDPAVSSDDEDLDSLSTRGIFGWATLDAINLPYIFRKKQKLVAVRIVQKILSEKQKTLFLRELTTHLSPKSYYVTKAEANLLNEINTQHCGMQFGYGENVFTTNDLIVELKWLEEIYNIKKSCVKNMEILGSRISKTPVINQFNFHGTNVSDKAYNKTVLVAAHKNCKVVSVNNQGDGQTVYISSSAHSPTLTTSSHKGLSVTSSFLQQNRHHQYPQKAQPKASSSTLISTQQPTFSVSVSTSVSSEIDLDAETLQVDTNRSEESGQKVTNQSTARIQYENVLAACQNSTSQFVRNLIASEKSDDSQFAECSSKISSVINTSNVENSMPVIISVQGSVTTHDLQSEDSQPDVIIQDDIVASPQVPVGSNNSDEAANEKPTDSTNASVDNVPHLSSFEVVLFRGQNIACAIREERNYCLIEVVCRQYFSQYGINDILYGMENVLHIPLLTCSDAEEKVFITFYGMPLSKLENGKLISFKDLTEYFLQLSYMYPQS